MTDRDEQRAKCIEAMADVGCRLARAHEIAAQEEGCIDWYEVMTAAFDALHGIATVCPLEATEEMIEGVDLDDYSLSNAWLARAGAGDLTNAPEKKP